jgi:hypothetical protein
VFQKDLPSFIPFSCFYFSSKLSGSNPSRIFQGNGLSLGWEAGA